ncbi:MAG: hypothetical protein Q8Q23_00660, partial [bacterium]|nr:hypothetical protein [bacterium]
ISHNARGICEVAGHERAKRVRVRTFRISRVLRCRSAPRSGASDEQNEGLPACVLQISEHGALAPAERFCRTPFYTKTIRIGANTCVLYAVRL